MKNHLSSCNFVTFCNLNFKKKVTKFSPMVVRISELCNLVT